MAVKRAKKAAAPRTTRTRSSEVRAWEEDPGTPEAAVKPIQRPVPDIATGSLPVAINGRAPAAKLYNPGTPEFRYWVAAEALERASELWGGLSPGTSWYRTVGPQLNVELDGGEDLNAYYDRRGLVFFHGSANGTMVYSGESPDIVCHEVGHAVLDAMRPQLFNAAFIEAAALHESFGDMSGLLCALQLRSVRDQVLVETEGYVYRASRLSRLAEQLGWAIRLVAPDAVEPDCLRNAVNSFFYQDPQTLPPSGPANTLSSEPHSFSRVFTAAFLEALAGMFRIQASQDEAALLQAAQDAGTLVVDAIANSPIVPTYYSQVAAHLIEADAARFGGRNTEVIKAAFVRHGILSLDSANTMSAPQTAARAPRRAAAPPADDDAALVALPGVRYGLGEDLLVHAPAEPKRFGVASAAADLGSVDAPAPDRAAQSFVEDLFRRGKVDMGAAGGTRAVAPPTRPSKMTHEVRREEDALVLVRRFFD